MSKTKKEQKSITTTDNKSLTTPIDDGWASGVTEENPKPPKVMVVQGTSKFVEEYAQGDIILSDGAETRKLADKGSSFDIIPFYVHKTWINYKLDPTTDDWRYMGESPRTPMNDGDQELTWTEGTNEDGSPTQLKKERATNVYCYLSGELSEETFPIWLQLKSTSNKHGNAIVKHFASCNQKRIAPVQNTWKVAPLYVKKPGKAYYEITLVKSDKSSLTAEQLTMLRNKSVEIHEAIQKAVNLYNSDSQENIRDVETTTTIPPKYDAAVENTAQY